MNEPQNRNLPFIGYKLFCSYVHEYAMFPENFDRLLKQLLKKYESSFENTMLFIMGDHGFRTGEYYNTEYGQKDHKSPFLSIKLPKKLEKTEFYKNLALNRNKYLCSWPSNQN